MRPQAVKARGGDVPEPKRAGRDERVEAVLADELRDLRQVVGVADEVLGVEIGPVAPGRFAGLRAVVGRDEGRHAALAQRLPHDAVAGAEVECRDVFRPHAGGGQQQLGEPARRCALQPVVHDLLVEAGNRVHPVVLVQAKRVLRAVGIADEQRLLRLVAAGLELDLVVHGFRHAPWRAV